MSYPLTASYTTITVKADYDIITYLWHSFDILRKSKEDTWVSNNTYWEMRKDLGFFHIDFPKLW